MAVQLSNAPHLDSPSRADEKHDDVVVGAAFAAVADRSLVPDLQVEDILDWTSVMWILWFASWRELSAPAAVDIVSDSDGQRRDHVFASCEDYAA